MKVKLCYCEEEVFFYPPYSMAGGTAVYCTNENSKGCGDVLMIADVFDGSDSSVGTVQWRKPKGQSEWLKEGIIEHSYQCDLQGSRIKCGYGGVCADEKHGVLLFLSNDTFWDKGQFDSIKKCRRLYYRLSYDNGYTWTDKKNIIAQGVDENEKAYDEMHFLSGVTYGVNSAAIVGPTMIETDDGALLTGVHVQEVDLQGNLIEPSGFMFLKSAALRAMWDEQKQDYAWSLSNYVSVDDQQSTRGIYEPSFAKLSENNYFMLMRASNFGREEDMLCTKFYSISSDNGKSWCAPEKITYDDKSAVYSSSSIPKLIVHTNGKIYYVGILNDKNPCGNLPRYPLCIAELDPKNFCIIKDSVVQIDTKRDSQGNEGENYFVDYSNHCVYEDRDTRELIVIAPYRKNLQIYQSGFNLYRINVM